jgi:hypothetical protein
VTGCSQRVKDASVGGEDSHCECNVGWLQPLLQRVKDVSLEKGGSSLLFVPYLVKGQHSKIQIVVASKVGGYRVTRGNFVFVYIFCKRGCKRWPKFHTRVQDGAKVFSREGLTSLRLKCAFWEGLTSSRLKCAFWARIS